MPRRCVPWGRLPRRCFASSAFEDLEEFPGRPKQFLARGAPENADAPSSSAPRRPLAPVSRGHHRGSSRSAEPTGSATPASIPDPVPRVGNSCCANVCRAPTPRGSAAAPSISASDARASRALPPTHAVIPRRPPYLGCVNRRITSSSPPGSTPAFCYGRKAGSAPRRSRPDVSRPIPGSPSRSA